MTCHLSAHTAIPTQKIHGWNGDYCVAIQSFEPGRADVHHAPRAEQHDVMLHFMDIMAEMHRIDVHGLDLAGFELPPGAEEHALMELRAVDDPRLAKLPMDASTVLGAFGRGWLVNHVPREVERTVLLQGDTGPGNFLFEDHRVTAVVDWEWAHYGDPREDVGNLWLRDYFTPSCGGDLTRLQKSLEEFFDGQLETLPAGHDQEPQQTLSFHRVLQRAVIHAQSAEKKEINGVNLLIAMYREPDSYAVYLLEEQGISRFALADLPGVGPRFSAALRRRGLVQVRDALAIDRSSLCLWFGPRTGEWLYQRIRGVGRATLATSHDPKSVSRENTFARDLDGDDEVTTELVRLTARVCRDLRDDGLQARTVTLKLRDFDFRTRQASRTVAAPVPTERAILPVALDLLQRLRTQRRVPVRLLGVALSHFSDGRGAPQLSLFEARSQMVPLETERDRRIAATMDRIQDRFGREAIRAARLTEPGADRGMIEEDADQGAGRPSQRHPVARGPRSR